MQVIRYSLGYFAAPIRVYHGGILVYTQCCRAGPFLTGSGSLSCKNRLNISKKMFLPSHLHTGSGTDQKVSAPTKKYRLRLRNTVYTLEPYPIGTHLRIANKIDNAPAFGCEYALLSDVK